MSKLFTDETGQDIAGQLLLIHNDIVALKKRDPNLTVNRNVVKTGVGIAQTVEVSRLGTGAITAVSSDTDVVTASVSGNSVEITRISSTSDATVTVSVAAADDYYGSSVVISVPHGLRYGYRIKKTESDPEARVEYLYDAVGKRPAHMDFGAGKFDYGDWKDEWFVTKNKPLMLQNDGNVGYYLNPNNYAQREDGTASDVANTSYGGNAMAQFPLVWVKRWEDTDYLYEVISDIQWDNDYKAYAHTRADGTIADYFYWSMFGGSGSASKIRSLSGQTLAKELTAAQEIAGCQANGAKWYTHTWSQRELIRTLLVLMGKSTDTQSVFGNGNCRSATDATGMLTTGTLKDKGQFFGYSSNNQQVKVFHIEKFWGDQWDRTAGIINNSGPIYAKMTPEGSGYRVTDVTGYTNSGATLTGTNGGYISAATCSELGIIPTKVSGSGGAYYCDGSWFNNSQLDYLFAGACADHATSIGGAFTFGVFDAPSIANWHIGCGLSCESPAA